jgi:hypothetical protein
MQSQKTKRRDSRRRVTAGIIRPLAADDPRNIDHPSHKERFLELARILGRLEAREEFERLHGRGQLDEATKTSSSD